MAEITLDELRKAHPNVNSAAIRYVRGEIDHAEYERQAEEERRLDRLVPSDRNAWARHLMRMLFVDGRIRARRYVVRSGRQR